MTRRILLALATTAAATGLFAAPAHADLCATVTETNTDTAAKVCVYDDGQVACGGHVGNTRFMCIV